MNSKTQANREAWNAVAKSHYENYHLEKILAGEPMLSELIKSEVGDVQGKSLIHLLCHIGSDTLSWRLLGAQVTGVDISPEAIQYAKKLAAQAGLEATFITCDVMDLLGKLKPEYDIVFASTGVLCWIPDIDRFALTIRQLLKPGGFFYLHDGHPFRNILGESEHGETIVKEDYFHQGVWEYDNFTDYVKEDLIIPTTSYEWNWSLGSVVTAFCQVGMRIGFLHEFPQNFYAGYSSYYENIVKHELFPCTFSLKVFAE
jgi:SAM-dependent methyltransferase